MNEEIINLTAKTLQIHKAQVKAVLNLLSEGATVPFIARYRKEVTGALNEDQIRAIAKDYDYALKLKERKEDVIRLIEEKGMMNDELKKAILEASKLTEVEDYYRPYKEKKKTRATVAIAKGLEPLANWIMLLPIKGDLEKEASQYINDDVTSIQEAIDGAKDIIAEKISDEVKYRQYTKNLINKTGILTTKLKKNAVDEKGIYAMYYEYSERIKNLREHRILAINRGEKEKILSVSFDIDKERFYDYINRSIVGHKKSVVNDIIEACVKDAFDRLIRPSIEREIRNELTERAEEKSLALFSTNLEHLLMQAPLKDKYVLGLDPGFRTGCKLAAVDPTGKVLGIDKCYISLPNKDHHQDEATLLRMIKDYHVEVIAMGNGTASRESEAWIAAFIKKYKLDVQYVIVSEAGASVYSASKLAKEEFPDFAVEERSAVSIARRLQDPLAELVKIDPKSISVGQYQHDMNQKALGEQLDFVVEKVVNQVGVNINTASPSLLQYVSGLSASTAKSIVKYREENGMFKQRQEVLDVPKLGPKTYEQAVGFLRIPEGLNILDETAIHPDNYDDAMRFLDYLHLSIADIGTSKMQEVLKTLNQEQAREELHFSTYLLEDLIDAFKAPSRSPRDEYEAPVLRSDVLTLDDLQLNMKLSGTVRNVVDFGAFVDIGLHEDGLVHISKMSKRHIKHPLEVVNVGDIVDVYVIDIDKKRNRVGLSMIAS
ncbi:RNA-binding transcriptional accessory protein [Sharpea azabuensis]|uniref:RNA-binding transcriptional accessory protein n=1 Tax=Sharpea porci TaxID=2652286 RepID=A0A844FTP5_9FIRM|nr:Tex family protein [Sharpea porci]MST88739.1 RNA-binding transcriptional accessory protein [Sharpea porci]